MSRKINVLLSVLAIFSIGLMAGCTEQIPQQKSNTKSVSTVYNPKINPDTNGYIMRASESGERVVSQVPETLAANNTVLVGHEGLEPSHVRGARIYDDFTIELSATVPGHNPIIAAIGTPTDPAMPAASDADSWRCSHCHGFDYEGGVYTFNNGATNNLLELQHVRERDEDFVVHMLMNGFDVWDGTGVVNVHNYTGLLTMQSMVDVADFVVNEIYDTHKYVQAPSSGSAHPESAAEGAELYSSTAVGTIPPIIRVDGSNFNCELCHGADGLLVAGIDLHTLAWTHPFEWLHRVNFGYPRALATFPDFTLDTTVHPGLYEVVLTHGLHFGGPGEASALMAHAQKNLAAAP